MFVSKILKGLETEAVSTFGQFLLCYIIEQVENDENFILTEKDLPFFSRKLVENLPFVLERLDYADLLCVSKVGDGYSFELTTKLNNIINNNLLINEVNEELIIKNNNKKKANNNSEICGKNCADVASKLVDVLEQKSYSATEAIEYIKQSFEKRNPFKKAKDLAQLSVMLKAIIIQGANTSPFRTQDVEGNAETLLENFIRQQLGFESPQTRSEEKTNANTEKPSLKDLTDNVAYLKKKQKHSIPATITGVCKNFYFGGDPLIFNFEILIRNTRLYARVFIKHQPILENYDRDDFEGKTIKISGLTTFSAWHAKNRGIPMIIDSCKDYKPIDF